MLAPDKLSVVAVVPAYRTAPLRKVFPEPISPAAPPSPGAGGAGAGPPNLLARFDGAARARSGVRRSYLGLGAA